MAFTEDQNNKIIRYIDIIENDIVPDLKEAIGRWHHQQDRRLDRISDDELHDLWAELVDTYYNMIGVDEPNNYDNWYEMDAEYAVEVSDAFVVHEHPKQVWIMSMEDLVYEKLPKALNVIEDVIDRYQPALLSLKAKYLIGAYHKRAQYP